MSNIPAFLQALSIAKRPSSQRNAKGAFEDGGQQSWVQVPLHGTSRFSLLTCARSRSR